MSKLIAKNVFQLPKMNLLVLTTSAFLLALDVILYKIAIGPAYFQLSFGFLSMACIGYLYGPIWGGQSKTDVSVPYMGLLCNPMFLVQMP